MQSPVFGVLCLYVYVAPLWPGPRDAGGAGLYWCIAGIACTTTCASKVQIYTWVARPVAGIKFQCSPADRSLQQ